MKRFYWQDLPRTEKIALLTFIVGSIAAICAILVVPEFRAALGLPIVAVSHSAAPIINTKTTNNEKATEQKAAQPQSPNRVPQEQQTNQQPPAEREKGAGLDESGMHSGPDQPGKNEKPPRATTNSEVQAERANPPAFESDTYRITVESLRKVDRTAVLVLGVEGREGKTVNVRICHWYLLDENGERWDEEGDDTAGLCDGAGGGVDVRRGIKIKTKLLFRSKEPRSGSQFTIVGSQLPDPSQPGKQVVITGVITE